jgi:hypothetical protein
MCLVGLEEVHERAQQYDADHDDRIQGTGETGRREGTPVWPAENALILSCVPECLVADVVGDLRKLRDARPQHTMPPKVAFD